MKKLTHLILLISLLIPITYHLQPMTYTYAAVPHLINYQGRLTDKDAKPLEGVYTLTFRIYDAENAGNLLWQETHSGVVIQKGIFNILLGSVTNLTLPFDKPYFLEIKVGDEVMSPRQTITSAGYAMRSETSENALQAQNATTVANVGVSTTPQPNKILPLDANAKLPVNALSLKSYDSGWFAISSYTNYTKTHSLGTTKCIITLMFASDANGTNAGAPRFLESGGNWYGLWWYGLTSTTIGIRMGLIVADLYNGSAFVTPTYGRIVMLALE